jgi:stage II sporulation protein D
MKSSLVKISFALAVISFYTYLFGIMDIVDYETQAGYANYGSPAGSFTDSYGTTTSGVTVTRIPDTRKMPGFADYDTPINFSATTAPAVTDSTPDGGTVSISPVSTNTGAGTTVSAVSGTTVHAPFTTPFIGTTTAPASTTRGSTTTTQPSPSNERFRVTSGGRVVESDAFDIVTRVVQNEIGSSFHKDAIKAQAIAAYTFIKRENERGTNPPVTVLLASSASDRVKEITREIWGQAIYFNNELISAVYSASAAGHTSSSRNVWGQDLPYLRSVREPFDRELDPNTNRTATFSSAEIRDNVARHTGIQLTGSPANWLRINSHVDTVYVGEMSVGGRTTFASGNTTVTITGRVFRERIMGFALRSASFTFSYDQGSDLFTFTTNGYGHGVGMSQNGAQILANRLGYTYSEILKFYYPGVEVR